MGVSTHQLIFTTKEVITKCVIHVNTNRWNLPSISISCINIKLVRTS